MNLALFASIAALGVGPLVHERTRGRWAVAAVDAFALTAVAGLVMDRTLRQPSTRSHPGRAPRIPDTAQARRLARPE